MAALRGAVCISIVTALLYSGPSPRGRCIMAAVAAADFEVKVHKVSESEKSSCVFGNNRDGARVKILLYAPASVILHSKLGPGGVYRLNPAPSKRGNALSLSYSSTIPTVTSCDLAGFPSYPPPIGVEQIDDTVADTYQDIRVTVSQDFGSREYDTKRGPVQGRALVCDGPGDQKFELVLWAEKAATEGIKKGVTLVFYDVWIKKNSNAERPLGRMELAGSLSAFGHCKVDTLMDDVVRAFTLANSPTRKRKLSELAAQALSPGDEAERLRDKLARYSVPGFEEDDEEVGSGRGKGNLEASASDAEGNGPGEEDLSAHAEDDPSGK